MIIPLFFSCAKPYQWVNPQEPENRDDMVTVLFSATEGGLSKISGITDASERHIGRWAVFAFDNSSSWFRYATSDSGGDIPMNLLAAHSYSCFAIVNYSTSGTGAFLPATVSTPDDLSEKVAYLGDNAVGNLLMYGSASFIPMTGVQDCTIPVKRIVSRINVAGISVDFSEKPHLAAKTFTLRHIYITNAYRTTTYGYDYSWAELSDARAACNPLALIPAAGLMGFMTTYANRYALFHNFSFDMSSLIQAVILFAIAFPRTFPMPRAITFSRRRLA